MAFFPNTLYMEETQNLDKLIKICISRGISPVKGALVSRDTQGGIKMRIMYSVLNILYSNKARSKLYALTQKDIIEALAADGEMWSERTIYNKLKALEEQKFIATGLRQSNSNTYYVTSEGINWMKEVEGDTENE